MGWPDPLCAVAPAAIDDDQPAVSFDPVWALPDSGSVLDTAIAYAQVGLELMPRFETRDGRLIDAISGGTRTGLIGTGPVLAYLEEFPNTPALAVVCGRYSNLLVVDLDRNHADGADGLATWRTLEAKHGPVTAPFVITPSGGRHLYFRWPGLRLKNGPIAPGVEILGERSAANLPPTTKRGKPYRWSLSRHPNHLPMPEPPAWLLEMARPKPRAITITTREALPDHYVAAAIEGIVADLEAARTNRNNALFRAAARFMDFVREGRASVQDMFDDLMPAAISNGLSEREARATLNSAKRLQK